MARSRIPRLAGGIIKLFFSLLIAAVWGVILWRMCSSGDPGSVSTLMVNENTLAAFSTYGEDMEAGYYFMDFDITLAEHNRGYFSVTQVVFLPEANQVQLVVRYNNSTLKHLQEDYGLESTPSPKEDWYDITLIQKEDLTPENGEDNDTEGTYSIERIFPSDTVVRENTSLYSYRRYLFDDVSLTDTTLCLDVDIYYKEDIRYNDPAYGTIRIFEVGKRYIPYELTAEDLRALRKED